MTAPTGFFTCTAGVNNNDVLATLLDVQQYNTFMFHITAGAADVFVSLDGTNFVGPCAMSDISDTSNDPVIIMAANKIYGLRGLFKKIRVDQNGATAVAAGTVAYGCF